MPLTDMFQDHALWSSNPLFTNSTSTYTTTIPSSTRVSSILMGITIELPRKEAKDCTALMIIPTAPRNSSIDFGNIVATYLLHVWNWFSYHHTTYVILGVLLRWLILQIWTTVSNGAPGCQRVYNALLAVKGLFRYQWFNLDVQKVLTYCGNLATILKLEIVKTDTTAAQAEIAEKNEALEASERALTCQKEISHARNVEARIQLTKAKQVAAAARAEITEKNKALEVVEWALASQKEISRARNVETCKQLTKAEQVAAAETVETALVQKELDTIKIEISNLKTQVDASDTHCAQKQTTITDLQKHNKELQDNISTKGRKLQELEGQIASKDVDISGLTIEVRH